MRVQILSLGIKMERHHFLKYVSKSMLRKKMQSIYVEGFEKKRVMLSLSCNISMNRKQQELILYNKSNYNI